MRVVLGFDPGGINAFGWSACQFSRDLPLRVLHQGVRNSARCAVDAAVRSVPVTAEVLAAGIDSPLCWATHGDRPSDKRVRDSIKEAGSPTPWGTVQIVNALRGACLVQGILAMRELRDRFPEIIVTEAHPKALLWLLKIADSEMPAVDVGPEQLLDYLLFREEPDVHERDAALGAVSAWAAVVRHPRWSDLLQLEDDPFFPAGKAVYYMPDVEKRAS